MSFKDHKIDSMHITHSCEISQTPSNSDIVNQNEPPKSLHEEEQSNPSSHFSLSLSGIPPPDPNKTNKIALVILGVFTVGCFVAYKRQSTTPPSAPIPPPKKYHLTGKLKTTITPN